MERNFSDCISFVLAREGGYVDDPRDPGGATNLGVTIGTLGQWRGRNVTRDEVKALTSREAMQIYHANYWLAAWCDALPGGVDLLVLDAAVNMGVEPSLQMLAEKLGLAWPPRDRHHHYNSLLGHLSPERKAIVLGAVGDVCMPALIAQLCQRRAEFYHSLNGFAAFGKGWLSRVDLAQRLAMRIWVRSAPGTYFAPGT